MQVDMWQLVTRQKKHWLSTAGMKYILFAVGEFPFVAQLHVILYPQSFVFLQLVHILLRHVNLGIRILRPGASTISFPSSVNEMLSSIRNVPASNSTSSHVRAANSPRLRAPIIALSKITCPPLQARQRAFTAANASFTCLGYRSTLN